MSRAQIEVRPNCKVSLANTVLGTVGDNVTVNTEEQIKCVFDNNLEVICLFLHKILCCRYSLELPRQGDSHEHTHVQHRFL